VQSITPSADRIVCAPLALNFPSLTLTADPENTVEMCLLTLPPEIQDEILFHLLDGYTGAYNRTLLIRADVLPYILANRTALDCWRANRHIILRRVAERRLRESADVRKALRRNMVLASLRRMVWFAVIQEYDEDRYGDRYWDANFAFQTSGAAWNAAEMVANFWRMFIRG
jgi:hypothetical protein